MILSALLAKGIPARGAISFGEFEVQGDSSGRHQVYFGRALIEAYRAERKENWIGIVILKSAWSLYEEHNPGCTAIFENERVWIKRHDDTLMLNPLVKLRGWYESDLIGEIDKPYLQWNAPEFPNDILAFKFLRDQASIYANRGDFSGKEAIKYHATIAFLKQVLGDDLYKWGIRISESDDT